MYKESMFACTYCMYSATVSYFVLFPLIETSKSYIWGRLLRGSKSSYSCTIRPAKSVLHFMTALCRKAQSILYHSFCLWNTSWKINHDSVVSQRSTTTSSVCLENIIPVKLYENSQILFRYVNWPSPITSSKLYKLAQCILYKLTDHNCQQCAWMAVILLPYKLTHGKLLKIIIKDEKCCLYISPRGITFRSILRTLLSPS